MPSADTYGSSLNLWKKPQGLTHRHTSISVILSSFLSIKCLSVVIKMTENIFHPDRSPVFVDKDEGHGGLPDVACQVYVFELPLCSLACIDPNSIHFVSLPFKLHRHLFSLMYLRCAFWYTVVTCSHFVTLSSFFGSDTQNNNVYE